MTPHPHADLLIAIAQGRQMQLSQGPTVWQNCLPASALHLIGSSMAYAVRISPDAPPAPSLEELVPEDQGGTILSSREAGFVSGWNSCRAEVLRRIALRKEGKL